MNSYEEELYHHGIKGQKWGIRRFQTKDGRLTRAGKKRRKEASEDPYDNDYAKVHDKKSVKYMSDNELRSRINRLQMEQNYKRLSKSNIDDGKKFVSDTLKVVSAIAATTGGILTIYENYEKIKRTIEKRMG